jgi:tRNA1Val (adenine37-N6)-methyltransferase
LLAQPETLHEDMTVDSVLRGELALAQPRHGYRFNVDALLVAHFALTHVPREPEVVVDLGAGCGVIGLLLARRWPACRVVLVELQPELARLAERNVVRNGLASRVHVVCGDLERADSWRCSQQGPVLAISNPPFFPMSSGRLSPNPMVARAKHEVSCTLSGLVAACDKGLRPGDMLVLIHDARRRNDLVGFLEAAGLRVGRVRMVAPFPHSDPHRVLLSVERLEDNGLARPGWVEEPILVVHERPQVYSAELAAMLGDGPETSRGTRT